MIVILKMNLTPLLVVLLGVVTVCSSDPQKSYKRNEIDPTHPPIQRQHDNNPYSSPMEVGPTDHPIRPQHKNVGKRDGHLYRDRSPSQPGPVVLTASGLVPPTFVPRNRDGSLNLAIIPGYAEFLFNSGIRAVEILGTHGEGPALSVDERKRVIDAWVLMGRKFGLHIMVQVGGVPYPEVLAMATYAQTAGADSILTLPEIYYKPPTVVDLVQYVGEVSAAAPLLPILYYHYPGMTGVNFPPQIIVRSLKGVPNFRGIKYDNNDLADLSATLREISYGHRLFLTTDRLYAPGALLGVRSALGGTINFWPQLVRDIFDAVEHSDVKRAKELQEKLTLGYEAILAAGDRIAAQKAAMEIVTGIKMGPPGLPLPLITPIARERLESQLTALGLVYKHLK